MGTFAVVSLMLSAATDPLVQQQHAAHENLTTMQNVTDTAYDDRVAAIMAVTFIVGCVQVRVTTCVYAIVAASNRRVASQLHHRVP